MEKMADKYTQKQWVEELINSRWCGKHASYFSSGCLLQCPVCEQVGCYGAKVTYNKLDEIARMYRVCKFCGWGQEAWGDVLQDRSRRGEDAEKPYRWILIHCTDCRHFVGKVPWDKLGECENCKSTKLARKKWPVDDKAHKFHELVEEMDEIHKTLELPVISVQK